MDNSDDQCVPQYVPISFFNLAYQFPYVVSFDNITNYINNQQYQVPQIDNLNVFDYSDFEYSDDEYDDY
jgi:hypothetical protein